MRTATFAIILAAAVLSSCDRCPPPSPIAMASPPAASSDSGPTVVVTRTGKKYHRMTCRYALDATRSLPIEDAAKTYEPCKVCKPPR